MNAPALPRIRVVVLNFDGGAITLRCLDALAATEYPPELLEIVVVDNASVDGLVWTLREQYPHVHLIESLVNEGFARGCNLAMSDLTGVDAVALVNNDAVVSPSWLRPLVDGLAEHPRRGAVVPKLLLNVRANGLLFDEPSANAGLAVVDVTVDGTSVTDSVRFDERWRVAGESDSGGIRRSPKGAASIWWPHERFDGRTVTIHVDVPHACTASLRTPVDAFVHDLPAGRSTIEVACQEAAWDIINSAGGELYTGWFGGDRGFLQPDIGQFDSPAETFAWCGGAVLLKVDYLAECGLFDPRFFLYYEDFDLSWRGRQLGWTYGYVPDSSVRHEHAYSSTAGSEFFEFWVDRNRRLALLKNAPAKVAARAVIDAVGATGRDSAKHVGAALAKRRRPSPRWLLKRWRRLASLLKSCPPVLQERRALRRRRVVGDAEIVRWMVTK